MSQSLIQRSLAGGEIGPALSGRADQVKYQTGAKTMRNMQVLKHGGAANRSGTKFVNEVKTSSLASYMAKFIFNDDQTYIIELGNEYFRFISGGSRIVVSGVVAWVTATVYAVGDLRSNGGTNYYCKVAHTSGATFAGDIANWHALTGVIYEIPTPYATADLQYLQMVQSGDVVTITHASYDPMELTRTGHTAWTLTTKLFAPGIAAPTSPANTGAAGTGGDAWVITSVAAETYEQSVASAVTETSATATSGAPVTVSWTAEPDAQEYNVFKRKNGVYGYIGVAIGTSFIDNGIVADTSNTPPITRNPFSGADNRPATVTYYQQRMMLGNQNSNTEKVFGSKSALFDNFTISSPLQDDDAVTFTVAGRKVNEIRHMIDIGTLVLLTASSEYIVEGDQDGILRANQPPNLRNLGNNGSSKVSPVIVNDSLIFIQARASIVRDLRYAISDGSQASYKGRDLTVFAGHLFTGKTLTRMDYAQIPNSIVWVVRSDGILLGLTYLPDHEVWGWHRHDTDGDIEDVCVVPEGGIDAVYLMVRREIDGVTKRYIERLSDRDFTDIRVDATFMDSFLTYDGRNAGSTTVTLSTGAGWTINDEITVMAAAGTPFAASYVDDDVVVWIDTDSIDEESGATVTTRTEVRIRVTTYTSSAVVSGFPDKTVPATLRSTALTTWGRAVDTVTGLDHLEGKDIAAFGDGNVIASPNNEDYTVVTVSGGEATFDRPYMVIHAGLPYYSDLRTLDMDVNGEQIRDRRKDITHISLLVESTRGIFAGPDLATLDELQPDPIENYGEPWPMTTGIVEMPIASTWRESGSFWVRQKDPLPITILSVIPSGEIGG